MSMNSRQGNVVLLNVAGAFSARSQEGPLNAAMVLRTNASYTRKTRRRILSVLGRGVRPLEVVSSWRSHRVAKMLVRSGNVVFENSNTMRLFPSVQRPSKARPVSLADFLGERAARRINGLRGARDVFQLPSGKRGATIIVLVSRLGLGLYGSSSTSIVSIITVQ